MNRERWMDQVEAALRGGDAQRAAEALQLAVAGLASAGPTPQTDRARALCAERLGELLEESGDLARAMQSYQEATDCYSRLPDAEEDARRCARRIVDGVKALRATPEERLFLLIARLEREQRQLGLEENSQRAQADLALRIATILHRRDRFAEAAARYQEALALYAQAPNTGMEQAVCHHRLAGLYHYELCDPFAAERHYRSAIALYAAHELPYEGEQMNRQLCEELLTGLRASGHR